MRFAGHDRCSQRSWGAGAGLAVALRQCQRRSLLIGYCERDFATLPAQARLFHRALREAGVPAELLFIPGQGHISEILHMAAEDDPIVQAMLRFMQR